jgi:glycosyltransferase involved in cell wall biosynthesis
VSTNVGGVVDVVTPEAGLLAPPGDDRALGAAMARLASDAELRAQMGEQAREHVRLRFSVEALIDKIDELYSELLKRRRG